MRIVGLAVLLLAAAGCQTLLPRGAQPIARPGSANMADQTGSGTQCTLPSPVPSIPGSPPCASAVCQSPLVEVKPCEEVHVKAPPQKVVVRRPGAPAGQQAQQIQQQVVNTQDVILVRQPVLVPYVRSTTFGNTTLSGLQQTQVFNALGVSVAGAAATEQTGAAALTATGSATAQIQEVRAQYDQRIAGYERRIEELRQQIEELSKRLPPAP